MIDKEETKAPSQDLGEASTSASPEAKRASPLAVFVRMWKQRAWVRVLVSVFALVIFSWILITRGNWQASAAWREGQLQTANAVGAALSNDVYRSDISRLDQILQRIAREGSFRSVTFTNLDGEVLSTTDAALRGQRLPELSRASWKATLSGGAKDMIVSRKIGLAEDNPRGILRIALNPRP